MVFFGTVPTQCIQQIVETVPFETWDEIYVCCSGSFKIEQALRGKLPATPIYSNDVSLWSTAIAKLVLGEPFDLHFQNKLQFVENLIGSNAPFADKVAAVLVAHEMSRFARNNEYSRKHYAYYEANFTSMLEKARESLAKFGEKLTIQGYHAGDWREHVDIAIAKGAGIAAFPPFFMGDYEKQYQFLEDNIAWEPPKYDLYSPNDLDGILTKIEESGVPYCILSDQLWDHRKPVMEYVQGRKKPHYCYASTDNRSIRHLSPKPLPFKYVPIDLSKISAKSQCQVVPADSGHMNYIKDIYLAKGIVHTTGMQNYLVYIDGMLVGGIIYSLSKYGIGQYKASETLYLLSDVTISSEGKLSKLVATLATSRTLIAAMEARLFQRINLVVVTTARSHKPVSMKYRGIYELMSRRVADSPEEGNILQYGSKIRELPPQEIYREWFGKYHKHGKKKNGKA